MCSVPCAALPHLQQEPKPPKPVKEKVVIVKEIVKEPKVFVHKDKPHHKDHYPGGGYAATASTAATAPVPGN